MRLLRALPERQFHRESRTPVRLSIRPDFPFMDIHDLFDDRQSQSAPAYGAVTGLIRFVERLENVDPLVLRYSYAVIRYANERRPAVGIGANANPSVDRSEFNGVAQQIRPYLAELILIRMNGYQFQVQFDDDFFA